MQSECCAVFFCTMFWYRSQTEDIRITSRKKFKIHLFSGNYPNLVLICIEVFALFTLIITIMIHVQCSMFIVIVIMVRIQKIQRETKCSGVCYGHWCLMWMSNSNKRVDLFLIFRGLIVFLSFFYVWCLQICTFFWFALFRFSIVDSVGCFRRATFRSFGVFFFLAICFWLQFTTKILINLCIVSMLSM